MLLTGQARFPQGRRQDDTIYASAIYPSHCRLRQNLLCSYNMPHRLASCHALHGKELHAAKWHLKLLCVAAGILDKDTPFWSMFSLEHQPVSHFLQRWAPPISHQ